MPGPQGPTGIPGGAGPAYYTRARDAVTLPGQYLSILHLDVPAGSYVVSASVLVNNLGQARVATLCSLSSPVDTSETVGVQLEPELPQTEGRASGATIAVGMAITLSQPGRIDLLCVSNSGVPDATAQAEGRQLTATTVGSVVLQ